MTHIDFLVEKYTVNESMSAFLDMVARYFKAFIDDVERLSKHMIKPWATRVDVLKMQRQGWKIEKHTSHGDHELWLMKKGKEEQILGY